MCQINDSSFTWRKITEEIGDKLFREIESFCAISLHISDGREQWSQHSLLFSPNSSSVTPWIGEVCRVNFWRVSTKKIVRGRLRNTASNLPRQLGCNFGRQTKEQTMAVIKNAFLAVRAALGKFILFWIRGYKIFRAVLKHTAQES